MPLTKVSIAGPDGRTIGDKSLFSFMMKFNRSVFHLVFCFCLTHCQYSSNQIKDAFKTVDNSLEKSNNVLSNTIEGLYSAIQSTRQKNEQLALKADSIYFAANEANKFIDSLKQRMQLQDTSVTNLDLATKLLVFTNTGDSLTKLLLNG